MPTKIFTTIPGRCPFGYHNNIDDNLCRLCPYYFRTGTGTFFWCNHPVQEKPKRKPKPPTETDEPRRKRGRPPKNGHKSPVKSTKPKKR